MNLYEKFAGEIEQQVLRGVLRPGERIPSVRRAKTHHQLSITTVLRAYMLLESKGLIESRPQSGYFVRSTVPEKRGTMVPKTSAPRPLALSSKVDVSHLVVTTLRSISANHALPLGSPYPDTTWFPIQRLNRYTYSISRRQTEWGMPTELPLGRPELIREIAKRYLQEGTIVDPGEIVVTLGATEAINLCLQAVARPGAIVAVESPAFYSMLHAIERLGMRAMEIPTDPRTGMDVNALELLIKRQRVAACMVMPNFQNPLGFQMPDEAKQKLVALMTKRGVPIIENAVCNELYFGESFPTTLRAFDTKGIVLQCGSFSKTLAPTLNVGWVLTGQYRAQIEKLKFLNRVTTPSVSQLAIAEFLQRDGYDHHLRRLRKIYAQQVRLMTSAIARFFPPGTRISRPAGGYMLWVELDRRIHSMELYRRALECGMTVGPGCMFSASKAYGHCIRLNFSYAWSPKVEAALAQLGQIVSTMLSDAS